MNVGTTAPVQIEVDITAVCIYGAWSPKAIKKVLQDNDNSSARLIAAGADVDVTVNASQRRGLVHDMQLQMILQAVGEQLNMSMQIIFNGRIFPTSEIRHVHNALRHRGVVRFWFYDAGSVPIA